MWKKVALSAAAVTTIAGVTYGAGAFNKVAAQEGPGAGQDSLVQRLAERFGLDQSEVQEFFEEERQLRMEQHHQMMRKRLDEAVTDGKLTEEQRAAIEAKHQELKADREALQESWDDMTQEERKTLKEEHRAEMEAWAEENGIEFSLFKFGGPGHRGGNQGLGQGGQLQS